MDILCENESVPNAPVFAKLIAAEVLLPTVNKVVLVVIFRHRHCYILYQDIY